MPAFDALSDTVLNYLPGGGGSGSGGSGGGAWGPLGALSPLARALLLALLALLAAAVGLTLVAPDVARSLGLAYGGPVLARTTLWTPPVGGGSLLVTPRDLPGDSEAARRAFAAKGAYSMLVEVQLGDPRRDIRKQGKQLLFRHLLHRGSAADSTAVAAYVAGQPPRANPAILLDPVRPDLILRVDTQGVPLPAPHAVRIEDVPVGRPFRVGLVVSGRRMDVYLDGKLHSTTLLRAPPVDLRGTDAGGTWYGLVSGIAAPASLQNLVLWDGAVGPAEMAAASKRPPAAFGAGSCGGGPTVPP